MLCEGWTTLVEETDISKRITQKHKVVTVTNATKERRRCRKNIRRGKEREGEGKEGWPR